MRAAARERRPDIPAVNDDSYRELVFQNDHIVYVAAGTGVVIIGVIHAAMDMKRQVRDRGRDIT